MAPIQVHSDSLIKEVLTHYPELSEKALNQVTPITHGHINRSFKVSISDILLFVQQINHNVFPRVAELAQHLTNVEKELKAYYRDHNFSYETLGYFTSNNGENYVKVKDVYWRVSDFKSELQTFQAAKNSLMVDSAAKAYAHFSLGLAKLPLATAFESIPRFHDITYRYVQLIEAINLKKPTESEVLRLIAKAESLFNLLEPVYNAWQTGRLPKRWTHNDTKINNLLFDVNHSAKCVIDLDTVMPGSILFDIGDALRTICVNLPEDDPGIDQLIINKQYLDTFVTTYVSIYRHSITELERQLIPYAGIYMAAIMGIRFLTDYILGNQYYNIDYSRQNLNRAINQLALAEEFSLIL